MVLRFVALIPTVALAVLAAGLGVCSMAGFQMHLRDAIMAMGVSVFASLVGLVPLYLTRGTSQGSVSQAGLAGTVVQMLLALFISMGLMLGRLLHHVPSYFLWLMMFYWALLIVLVAATIAAIGKAPAAARAAGSADRLTDAKSVA